MVDKKKEENQVTAEAETSMDTATQGTPTADSVEQNNGTETDTGTTTAETTSGPNVLERISGVVKKFYPDVDIDTAIELPGPVVALMEKLLPPIEGIVQFHDDVYKVVEDYPEFGEFMIALRNGYAPYEAYVEYLEPEEPGEGAPDFEGSKAARERRSQMSMKRKERETTVNKNIETSLADLETLAKENNWTPEQTQEYVENVANLYADWADGKLTLESQRRLAKGFSFDTIVKQKDEEIDQAFEDGKVNGRNEKIQKRRVTQDTGDGLPRMTGAGEGNNKKKADKFTSELEQMGNRKSILG